MGHKKVCLDCRESLNLDHTGDLYSNKYPCAKCGREMRILPHRFRPPKKTDDKGWELVEFLIKNGFPFQHIYQQGLSEYFKNPVESYVSYPTNIRDAKEFVVKHKDQAINKDS
jgi:hypothetical protein